MKTILAILIPHWEYPDTPWVPIRPTYFWFGNNSLWYLIPRSYCLCPHPWGRTSPPLNNPDTLTWEPQHTPYALVEGPSLLTYALLPLVGGK